MLLLLFSLVKPSPSTSWQAINSRKNGSLGQILSRIVPFVFIPLAASQVQWLLL
jgi:hypothetical protein